MPNCAKHIVDMKIQLTESLPVYGFRLFSWFSEFLFIQPRSTVLHGLPLLLKRFSFISEASHYSKTYEHLGPESGPVGRNLGIYLLCSPHLHPWGPGCNRLGKLWPLDQSLLLCQSSQPVWEKILSKKWESEKWEAHKTTMPTSKSNISTTVALLPISSCESLNISSWFKRK